MATSFTIRPSGQGSNTTVTDIGETYSNIWSASPGSNTVMTASNTEWEQAKSVSGTGFPNDFTCYIAPTNGPHPWEEFGDMIGPWGNTNGTGRMFTFLKTGSVDISDDQVVEIVHRDRSSSFDYIGPMLRYSIGGPGNESGSGYCIFPTYAWNGIGGSFGIARLDNGTLTNLSNFNGVAGHGRRTEWTHSNTSPADLQNKPHFRFRAQITGSTIALINAETGQIFATTTDSTYTSGSVGICMTRNNQASAHIYSYLYMPYSDLIKGGNYDSNNVSRRPVTLRPS